jgi:hypothetical protein
VNWNLVEASWQRFRDEVHPNCGRLTSAHVDLIAGSRAFLRVRLKRRMASRATKPNGRLRASKCATSILVR